MQEVKQQYKENLFSIGFDKLPKDAYGTPAFDIAGTKNQSLVVKINEGYTPNHILHHFIQQQAGIVSFNEILPSLNDIFIKLVEGTPLTRQFQPVTV